MYLLNIPFIDVQIIVCVFNRKDWVADIKMVADRLSITDDLDVEMSSHSESGAGFIDVAAFNELSAKCSVQGFVHGKSSGKKKVVCIVFFYKYSALP